MVRFLHTADWQIGMTRSYLTAEAQPRFAASRVDAVRRLGQVAQEQGCAFVVVAGDVFEHNQLTAQTLRRAIEALRSVPVPVYLLPGNHDHLGPMSVWSSPVLREELPEHVHVLDTPGPRAVAPGVELVAAPWVGKHPEGDPVAEALALLPEGPAPEGTVRVLVGHGGVDVLDPQRRNRAAIVASRLSEGLDHGRLHYVALGDRHSLTQIADDPAIWFSGAPEPTSWREERPGEVLVVEAAPGPVGARGTVRVTPHAVASWRYVSMLDRRVDGDADLDALAADLDALSDKERTLVRLGLRGTLGLAQHARLEEILERRGQLLATLHRPRQHQDVALVDADGEMADLGLGGFLASAADEIRAEILAAEVEGVTETERAKAGAAGTEPLQPFQADLPDDGASARDAMTLLYRLSRGGSR